MTWPGVTPMGAFGTVVDVKGKNIAPSGPVFAPALHALGEMSAIRSS
jgi:hypothetical protein